MIVLLAEWLPTGLAQPAHVWFGIYEELED